MLIRRCGIAACGIALRKYLLPPFKPLMGTGGRRLRPGHGGEPHQSPGHRTPYPAFAGVRSKQNSASA